MYIDHYNQYLWNICSLDFFSFVSEFSFLISKLILNLFDKYNIKILLKLVCQCSHLLQRLYHFFSETQVSSWTFQNSKLLGMKLSFPRKSWSLLPNWSLWTPLLVAETLIPPWTHHWGPSTSPWHWPRCHCLAGQECWAAWWRSGTRPPARFQGKHRHHPWNLEKCKWIDNISVDAYCIFRPAVSQPKFTQLFI